MRTEVLTAAKWWADVLREYLADACREGEDLPAQFEAADRFQQELATALTTRYTGHWYREDPERGHAYRSINLEEFQPDPLLAAAARGAGLSVRRVHKALLRCPLGSVVMFCDPFNVTLLQRHPRVEHNIYSNTEKLTKHMPAVLQDSASGQLLVAKQLYSQRPHHAPMRFSGSGSASASSSSDEESTPGRPAARSNVQPTVARGSNLLFTVKGRHVDRR